MTYLNTRLLIRWRLLALALGAVLALQADAGILRAATGDQAGVAGAVRGDVTQISYQDVEKDEPIGREVDSGDDIFLGDRIDTETESGLQIMLLDETTFTIGPGASMVVDEFVYDPDTGAGRLAASVTRGAFRFVSGQITRQNPENVRINLPGATLGVRGTSVLIFTNGTSTYVVHLGQGDNNNTGDPASSVNVTSGGSTKTIYRPGWAVRIDGPGQEPTDPFPIDPNLLAQWLDMLATGGTGQDGSQSGGAFNDANQDAMNGQIYAQEILEILGWTNETDGTVNIILQTNDEMMEQMQQVEEMEMEEPECDWEVCEYYED